MIVKMIQNLENNLELQINSLETRIEKMQENFNKDLEEIKKSQSIMNNAITEIKSTQIIFTIIILNSFSCRLPVSSSFVWFGVHLSCSFTYWIFLCLFILFRLLCLGLPFCMLEVCGSSLLWRFLTVGGVGRVACQGFLVREACVSVLVGGAGSLLSGVQWSVQEWVLSYVWVWCDFWLPAF